MDAMMIRRATLTLLAIGCAKPASPTPTAVATATPATSASASSSASATTAAAAATPTAPVDDKPSLHELTSPRRAPHAYGRGGDLLLTTTGGATLTIARTDDVAGHRPMKGSILDAQPVAADAADPMLWHRVAYRSKDGPSRWMIGESVTEEKCGALPGVRIKGSRDGVSHSTLVCATDTPSMFTIATAMTALPAGAVWGDEMHPGTSIPIVANDGGAWEGTRSSPFVAMAENEVAILLSFPETKVHRKLIHIAGETFPSAVFVEYPGTSGTRNMYVGRGDEIDAVGLASGSTPANTATMEQVAGVRPALWRVVVRGEGTKNLARGRYQTADTRSFRVPSGFGRKIVVMDETDRVLGETSIAKAGAATLSAKPKPVAHLHASYTDEKNAPVPAHVIVRGREGTPDPDLGGVHVESSSWFLPSGSGDIAIPPGSYEIVATHGMAYGISRERVKIGEGEQSSVKGTIARVIPAEGWVSVDLHLHAQPSPDSKVSFDTRVASLVAEGLDFAIPTDHNRISDYQESIDRVAPGQLASVPGVEITSAGSQQFGHFNAYPMPRSNRAPEDAVPVYYDTPPRAMFQDAMNLGARVIQVNHARMPPQIGYFELTHFDPKTGDADALFAPGFHAFEAHNGLWFAYKDKVREGVVDLVGLARRGLHIAAVGNSDSHTLHFETVGWPRTWVHTAREPYATLGERVVAAILRGDTSVSAGPFVTMTVDGADIGAKVVPKEKGKVSVHVRVEAPAWVGTTRLEILRDDKTILTFPITTKTDGLRLEKDITVDVPTDCTLLAWVESDTKIGNAHAVTSGIPIGFTGLVYVDANGDGKVDVAHR